jgi:hypothetical protein
MRATTPGGQLVGMSNCYIIIPNYGPIYLNNLPELSDQKQANYTDEAIIGRADTIKTYSHSGGRKIGMQIHLIIVHPRDIQINLQILRLLESAVYPRNETSAGVPFIPPPVCRIKCGDLLAKDEELCVILESYSVKFPTDVVWDDEFFTPYKFDVDLSWQVVYRSQDLPGQNRIVQIGR